MIFTFREFVVDDTLFVLVKNGVKQEVEPRIFELLVYFCKNPNVPISRGELIEHVWQGRVVGDAAINRAVSELRKTIEVKPSKPELIITISKVGYQLTEIPEVENVKSDNFNLSQEVKAKSKEQERVNSNSVVQKKSINTNIVRRFVYSTIFLSILIIVVNLLISDKTNGISVEVSERPLTSLKGSSYKAKQSRNGDSLVFIHKSKANDYPQVWLKNNDAPPIKLTDNSYYTFAVFGNKNQIIASRFNNLEQRKCEIVSIDVLTYQVNKIIDCADRALTALAYSFKRNTLYFNLRAEASAPFSIYSYQLETARLQQVTFPYDKSNIKGDFMLALSPTEDRLAIFEYQESSLSVLKVVSLMTDDVIYHEQEFSSSLSLSWLDNDQLVLSGGEGLKVYNINNKDLKLLIANTSISYASANPFTGEVVFNKGIIVANIYQYEIKSSHVEKNKRAVTHSSFVNYSPQFANRSNKNAYITNEGGVVSIIIQPAQGNAYNTNFNEEIDGFANLHWSPDDNYLVVSINGQLRLFNEKSRVWKTLLPDNKSIHSVHFSNKQNIIFSSDLGGDWQIWSLNILTGKLTQLTTKGGYSAQGDIDSSYIYLTKFNQVGLYRLNLSTGEEKEIIPNFKITSWNKWQLRNDTIYYLTDKHIEALNLVNNEVQEVLPNGDRAPSSFSLSYDEQYIQREVLEESSANIWSVELK